MQYNTNGYWTFWMRNIHPKYHSVVVCTGLAQCRHMTAVYLLATPYKYLSTFFVWFIFLASNSVIIIINTYFLRLITLFRNLSVIVLVQNFFSYFYLKCAQFPRAAFFSTHFGKWDKNNRQKIVFLCHM